MTYLILISLILCFLTAWLLGRQELKQVRWELMLLTKKSDLKSAPKVNPPLPRTLWKIGDIIEMDMGRSAVVHAAITDFKDEDGDEDRAVVEILGVSQPDNPKRPRNTWVLNVSLLRRPKD